MANNSHKPFSQLLSIVVAWNIFPFQKSNRIFIIGPKCRTSRTQPCLGAMLFEIKSLHPWPIWKTEMKNKVDCCNTFWDIVHRGTLTHTDMGITISLVQKSGRCEVEWKEATTKSQVHAYITANEYLSAIFCTYDILVSVVMILWVEQS